MDCISAQPAACLQSRISLVGKQRQGRHISGRMGPQCCVLLRYGVEDVRQKALASALVFFSCQAEEAEVRR